MTQTSQQSELKSARFDFFTNHAHVLLLIARGGDLRMRELAVEVGITERAVQRIVEDLIAGGYLIVTKTGRRNYYRVEGGVPLRHHVEAHRSVGDLVQFIFPDYAELKMPQSSH